MGNTAIDYAKAVNGNQRFVFGAPAAKSVDFSCSSKGTTWSLGGTFDETAGMWVSRGLVPGKLKDPTPMDKHHTASYELSVEVDGNMYTSDEENGWKDEFSCLLKTLEPKPEAAPKKKSTKAKAKAKGKSKKKAPTKAKGKPVKAKTK
jgi:hypothetical protein